MHEKFEKYCYRGNIEEALDTIGDSQVIVGTRFHANILGFLMNKVVIPIAYSDKTTNVLSDLKFSGKIFDIRFKEGLSFDNLDDVILSNNFDMSVINKNLNDPFEKVDMILERK
jgi:colanic acid/amylovoran biosynthesis protein